jgi:hypothetical protein
MVAIGAIYSIPGLLAAQYATSDLPTSLDRKGEMHLKLDVVVPVVRPTSAPGGSQFTIDATHLRRREQFAARERGQCER